MNGYSTFSNILELERSYQFCGDLGHSLGEEVLSLCKDAVGIFGSLSQFLLHMNII